MVPVRAGEKGGAALKGRIRPIATSCALLALAGELAALAVLTPVAQTRMPANVFYASKLAGVHGDGMADDTAPLQAALSRLGGLGGGTLFIDCPRGNVVAALTIPSGVTVDGLGVGHLAEKAGGGSVMLRNPDFVASVPAAPTPPTDHDITIRDLSLDGNSRGGSANGAAWGQVGADNLLACTVKMFGVTNLRLENVKVYDSPAYGIFCSNVSGGTFVHDSVLIPYHVAGAPANGRDGLHFVGPDAALNIVDFTYNGNDDAIPLNCDDGNVAADGSVPRPNNEFGAGYVGRGPIHGVVINGVHLQGSDQGVRVLSGFPDSSADDVRVENVTGTFYKFAVSVDQYVFAAGHVGRLSIRNVSAQALRPYPGEAFPGLLPCVIGVGIDIDSLTVDGGVMESNGDGRPFLWLFTTNDKAGIGSENDAGNYRAVTVRDVRCFDPMKGAGGNAVVKVTGHCHSLALSGVSWVTARANRRPVLGVAGSGSVDSLSASDVVTSGPILAGNPPAARTGDAFAAAPRRHDKPE